MKLLAMCALFAMQAAWCTAPLSAQAASSAHAPDPTFRSSADLVLVDVFARNSSNGLPDQTLRREDFQVFDNGRPVAIKTFDSGAQSSTRPLTLWFVVQCRMPDYDGQGSGLFAGHTGLLASALKDVDPNDTVAVAHWCDNGDSSLDLLPTNDTDSALKILESVLAPVVPSKSHDRPGELALQKTLQLIVDTTRASQLRPLPVVIFLYGDYSGMPRKEADHFIGELLETSAIAFGLRDRRSPSVGWIIGEQSEVAHYIANQTGGQYLDVTPQTYADGLSEILRQLHFRYELGFQPQSLDGKRHKLEVKLTGTAAHDHKTIRLRHRAAYVPVPAGGRL
jgi:hypothetical protein